MENPSKRMGKVEELENFPFESFTELRKAHFDNMIQLHVDRAAAREWAERGIYSPRSLRVQASVLFLLPTLLVIGFIGYAIICREWILFLGLPVVILGMVTFHPNANIYSVMFRGFAFIRQALILLTFAGFVWALWVGNSNILMLTGTLLAIWYSWKTLYDKSVRAIITAATEHEGLLCMLWETTALSISFPSGKVYWADSKIDNGKSVGYE